MGIKNARIITIYNNNMQFTATKLCTAFLALIALMQFVSGATLYSEMTPEITVGVSGVALADGCAPTTYTGGASSLTVKWSGLTVAPAKIAIKLCYTKDQIVDRAWRKFKDNIKDNKQCKQTADTAKFFGGTVCVHRIGGREGSCHSNEYGADDVHRASVGHGRYRGVYPIRGQFVERVPH